MSLRTQIAISVSLILLSAIIVIGRFLTGSSVQAMLGSSLSGIIGVLLLINALRGSRYAQQDQGAVPTHVVRQRVAWALGGLSAGAILSFVTFTVLLNTVGVERAVALRIAPVVATIVAVAIMFYGFKASR